MSSRVIAGTVILLVLVVGGIFLLIANLNGGDADTGSISTPARAPQTATLA
jgi:hypothetical protein